MRHPREDHTQWAKTTNVFLKIGNKQEYQLLPLLFNTVLGVLPIEIRQAEKNKRHPNWKGRSKTDICDDMILYRENPKDSTKRLLELINKFSKVAVYKINIQKSVAFLYTNNVLSEKLRKQPHLQLH